MTEGYVSFTCNNCGEKYEVKSILTHFNCRCGAGAQIIVNNGADKKSKFIQELTALSKKYDIYIGGCGCCDSPYLENGEPTYNGNGELQWDVDKKEYKMDSDE